MRAHLSFEQEHLWNRQWTANIPPLGLFINGVINAAAMQGALQQLAARQGALRTCFQVHQGVPMQVISDDVEIPFPTIDISRQNRSSALELARTYLRTQATSPFDLERAPLIRAGLIKLSENEHILHVTLHHIIADLWSMPILMREFSALYAAQIDGTPISLPPLPTQYGDYAMWQRLHLCGALRERYLSYWRRVLRGATRLSLAASEKIANPEGDEGGVCSMIVDAKLSTDLQSFARQERVSLFMALLCVFKLLLFARTGATDISVSSLVANRTKLDIEQLIGVFANRLLFRTHLDGRLTFRESLKRVCDVCLEAYSYQELSLWKVCALEPQLLAHSNIGLLFALQNVPGSSFELKGLEVTAFENTGISMFEQTGMLTTGRYDQSWEIWKQHDSSLKVVLSYRKDLFTPIEVSNLLLAYRRILSAFVTAPDTLLEGQLLSTLISVGGHNGATVESPSDLAARRIINDE